MGAKRLQQQIQNSSMRPVKISDNVAFKDQAMKIQDGK
jgi:hypothetical protein